MAARRSDSPPRTKADLVRLVYDLHGGLTKTEAAEVVDTIFKTMKTTLLDGRKIKIHKFGVFEVADRQGRKGVDPSNGERIYIPPRKSLSFRPARGVKQAVDRVRRDDS